MEMVDSPLLRAVPADEAREILSHARRRTFTKGEVVFHEGDPADMLHLISRGRFVEKVAASSGDSIALAVFGVGDVFGELALLDGNARRTATASALEAGETLSIDAPTLSRLRQTYPGVNDTLLTLVAQKVARYTQHLVEALYLPADRRVLRRILELRGSYGDMIPLRQGDIAALAGTSRATVNQVLGKEQGRGTVDLSRSQIEILDADALEQRSR